MSQYNLNISTIKAWSTGFKMELALTNTGTEPIENPYVDIAGSAEISNLWGGGSFTRLDTGVYRIYFNELTVAPGEVVDVGLRAQGVPDFDLLAGHAETAESEHDNGMQTPENTTPEIEVIAPPAPEMAIPLPTGISVKVDSGTSAAALEKMIRDADAGTTFELQSGTYHFDRTLTIDRSDVALLGAGTDQTVIKVAPHLNQEAFAIGDGGRVGDFSLAQSVNEGATTLSLETSHSFEAGDFVYLSRESTSAFYDSIDDDTWRRTDVPLRTSIVEVRSVDGNTLTLDRGVHFDFAKSETTVKEIAMVENVTLGGFAIDYDLGVADPSSFENTLSAYDRDAVIQVEGTSGLKLLDVTSRDVPSLGVNVALSTGMTADGINITGAHNKGGGGNGYALQIRDVYDSNLTNLTDMDMRHSVVFASWRSAVDNLVHVARTDRDINFHGGRDHGNVVRVDESIRDANSDIISPTLFVNTEGTHYGSVTDPDANDVRFGKVMGTRLNDDIQGYDGGSWLDGQGGNDILTGGSANDVLIGGEGRDTLVGGPGNDIAVYTGDFADFVISGLGDGRVEVDDRSGGQSRDTVDAEWLAFDDGVLRLSDMAFLDRAVVDGIFEGINFFQPSETELPQKEVPAAPLPVEPTVDPINEQPVMIDGSGPVLYGTDGKDTFVVTQENTSVHGYNNWDVVESFYDFKMHSDIEKLQLVGAMSINAEGSESADLILGNDARNIVRAKEGDDRVWARDGDDMVFGGSGDDTLDGGAGDDLLHGGGGADLLTGRSGEDTFRFDDVAYSRPGAADTIDDFVSGQDMIDLALIDANIMQDGDQGFVWNGSGAGAIWYEAGQLRGDVDGNGSADIAIDLLGAIVEEQDLFL